MVFIYGFHKWLKRFRPKCRQIGPSGFAEDRYHRIILNRLNYPDRRSYLKTLKVNAKHGIENNLNPPVHGEGCLSPEARTG